jgi:anti-anti-sigma factor
MKRFSISERDVSGQRVMEISGELDVPVVRQLEDAFGPIESGRLVVDLSRCEFIDSSAIAVLVLTHQRLADTGGGLRVASPTDRVRRVLAVTGLASQGLVFPSVEEALAGPPPWTPGE